MRKSLRFRKLQLAALAAAAVAAVVLLFGTGGGGVGTTSAEAAEATTVRIAAQRVEDGRTAFALQVRGDDGWGERIEPRANLFKRVEDARVGRWANSSLLELESGHTVRISARLQDDGRIEFALQEIIDDAPAERILPRLRKFPANPTVGKWLYSSPIELAAIDTGPPPPTHIALVNYSGQHAANVRYNSSLNEDGSVTSNVYTNSEEGGEFGQDGYGGSFAVWCWSSENLGILIDGLAPQDAESFPVTLTIDGATQPSTDWKIGNHYRDDVVTHSWLELRDDAARTLFEQLQSASQLSAAIDGVGGTHTWNLSDTFSTPIQGNIDECGNYVEGQVQEPPPPTYVPVTNAGGWSGPVRYSAWTNADDGTVSTRLQAFPHADDDSGLGAELIVACWSSQHSALQIENLPTMDANSVRVTLRIDGADPITETWNVWNGQEDSDADSNVHTGYSQLTDPRFRTASSVIVEIGATDPMIVAFDITGLFDTPVQGNLDECGNYVEGQTSEIEYEYVPWTGNERVSASLQYRAFVTGDGVNTDIYNDVPTQGAVDGRLRFHVSCWSQGTSLNMQVLGFLMGEQRPVEVTITFADGSTHVSNWRVSDWNGNGVQTHLPPNLMARFAASATATFAIDGVEYSPMTFDLNGMFELPVQDNLVNCGMAKRNASRELDLPESPVVSGSNEAPDGETRIGWYTQPSGTEVAYVFAYQFLWTDGEMELYLRTLCGPGGTEVMVFGSRFGELTEGDIEVTWSLDGGPEQTETWQVAEAFGRLVARPASARAIIDAWRDGSTLDLTLHTTESHTQRFHLAELFSTPIQAQLDECLSISPPNLTLPAGEISETEEGPLTYHSAKLAGSDVASMRVDLKLPSDDTPAWAGYSSIISVACGMGGIGVTISGLGLDRSVFIRGYAVEVTWSVDGGPESTSSWDVWPFNRDYYAISPQDDAAFYAAINGADSLTITVASDPEFVETYDLAANGFWTTPVQPNLDACVGS